MAHMIDFSNDRANMAYVGETPWHGLGTVMTPDQSLDDWTVNAGLNWSADKCQAGFLKNGIWHPYADKYTLVRDDTDMPLGTFTGRYKIHQPKEIMQFFSQFVGVSDQFSMECAGALKGGAVIWALAKYREELKVCGEEHLPYVLLTTSFDGSLATTAQATMIRVVCNNTLTASLFSKKAAQIKIRHNANFDMVKQDYALQSLSQVSEGFTEYSKMAEHLSQIRVTKVQVEKFLAGLIDYDPKANTAKLDKGEKVNLRKANIFDDMLAAYSETEKEGTVKKTAYTLLNAVTHFVDHKRATRRDSSIGETEGEARMYAANFGQGGALKSKAITQLLAQFDKTKFASV